MSTALKQLSYSSVLSLHSCPRKFQLDKLGVSAAISSASVTFAYGHAVGAGAQSLLSGGSLHDAVWDAFKAWDYPDIMATEDKAFKSFPYVYNALLQLYDLLSNGLLENYSVLYYKGKPACELGFKLLLPNGYTYRGYIDIVLISDTGIPLVVEIKTTGAYAIHPAQYKNSAQAVGYSIVLNHIVPTAKNYEVTYLAYKTRSKEWERLDFVKNYGQRSAFIRSLLLDMDTLITYEAEGFYPQRGESCYDYMRACKHIDVCGLDYDFQGQNSSSTDEPDYDIVLDLQDIITGLIGA